MAKKGASLRHQYQKLSTDKKSSLRKDIEATREEHCKIYCANPKAVQQDIEAAFNSMEKVYTILNYFVASTELFFKVDCGYFMHRS